MVSRLPHPTARPFKTRFRYGFVAEPLNLAGYDKSPDHYAKGTPSGIPLARHSPLTACRHVVSGSIPTLSGFFPSFARATCSLSVTREYLALRDGSRGFRRSFTCSVLLRCRLIGFACHLRDFHPVSSAIPRGSVKLLTTVMTVLQPH